MDTDDPSTADIQQPRVLHIDDGRSWRGGQHQVWLLLNELNAMNIPQRLIAPEGCPLTARAREIDIDVEATRLFGELDWHNPRRIADLARRFEANILHAHTSHAHAIALRAARRLRGQVSLVSTRRVDFPVGGPGLLKYFSRRKYQAPDQHYIAISEGVRQVLVAGGVHPDRIDVVHSGVPPIEPDKEWSRRKVRDALSIATNEIAIVNIGALTDHKGQRYLVEAAPKIFETLPMARIHILGEGKLRPALENQIRQAGLADKIILHGWIDDARLKLQGFDLFVLSSHLEGLGTVVLDAMLAGLPVVATATGGVPDVVIDGRTGRLVQPRDGHALADAIIDALHNPARTHTFIKAAQQHVQAHFSARSMAEGTLQVYRKLLHQKAPQENSNP